MGLFELHCEEILRSLVKRTEAVRSLLLSRMSQDNQKLNQEYVKLEYLYQKGIFDIGTHYALTTLEKCPLKTQGPTMP